MVILLFLISLCVLLLPEGVPNTMATFLIVD